MIGGRSTTFDNTSETRPLMLSDAEDIEAFLSVSFERYTMLGNYQAICSYDDGVIEALIAPLARTLPSRILLARLMGRPISSRNLEAEAESFQVELPSENRGGMHITLGKASEILEMLSQRSSAGVSMSITLRNLEVSRHGEATKLLERIANSFFFQVDLLLRMPLSLARRRRVLRPSGSHGRRENATALQFPTHEYDKAPISLYWYARSATGMPLLQFLAYYQVIEFYFPTYSQIEARRKIQNVLKDPSFRADKNTDIAKILSAVRSNSGTGYGDERSQLRATLRECVDPDHLRDFLTDNEQRQDFLSAKTKGLTEIKIPIGNVSADLRNDVADRLYDIRCKIVHTKGEGRNGDTDLLLPFSKEAEQLQFDIELVEYLAQRTLISSSSPLRI